MRMPLSCQDKKGREGGRRRKERGGEKLKKNGVLLAGYEGGWWG